MNDKNICPYHPDVSGEDFISKEWGETRVCYFIKDHSGAVDEIEKGWCKTLNHTRCKIFGRKKATEDGRREEYLVKLRTRGCSDAGGTFVYGGPSDGIC